MAPTKHRFSVEDYYRMAEAGVLGPDDRVELLDGELTLHAGDKAVPLAFADVAVDVSELLTTKSH